MTNNNNNNNNNNKCLYFAKKPRNAPPGRSVA